MQRIPFNFMCATILVFSTGTALAQSGQPAGDVMLVGKLSAQAVEMLDAGDYKGAIEAIREAEKHSRAPSLTVIAAEAYEKLGKLADAQRLYQSVAAIDLAQLKPPPKVNRRVWLDAQKEARQAAIDELPKLEPRVPYLTIGITGADLGVVRVTVGDESFDAAQLGREVPWNPGKYTVVAEIPGKEKASTEVDLKEGDKKSISLTLNRPPPPRPGISIPVGPTVAFGLAGVGLITGVIAGASAVEGANVTRQQCDLRRCYDYYYPTLTMSRVSTVAFLAGGASAAVGVVLLLVTGKKTDPPKTTADPPTIGVNLGLGFVGVRGKF